MAVTVTLDVGDVLKVTATVTVDGTATAPGTATFKVKDPAGTVETYVLGTDSEVDDPAVGTVTLEVPVASAGIWWVRFTTTAPQSAEEVAATVRRSKVI